MPIDCPAFVRRLFLRALIGLLFRLMPNLAVVAKFPLELDRLKFVPWKLRFRRRRFGLPLETFKRLRLRDLLRCLLPAFKFVFELARCMLDLDWERARFPFDAERFKFEIEFERWRRRRAPVLLMLFNLKFELRRAPRETPKRE